MIRLINADCLEAMRDIPDGSVDMVLTDPPYGTTACKWDSVIPFEPMWDQLKRITKPNGAIVLTASQPFTSALIMSNVKMFKYCWVWEKTLMTDFLNARNKPLKKHEDIAVFSSGTTANGSNRKMPYNSQPVKGKPYSVTSRSDKRIGIFAAGNRKPFAVGVTSKNDGTQLARSVLQFKSERGLHPTQKPVALMEYLIRTYTNAGDTVLDFTFGSGTTGVAAKNLGRSFIGIELDPDYFALASKRIADTPECGA
jgi:site-specific DNA-methyltransferase (adenine-specific)